MDRIYLDHAATTPLDPEVRAALAPWLGERFGNPSARHALGIEAAEELTRARVRIARALGVPSAQVILTSGGTESNALGVLGQARAEKKRGRRVVIGPTEHPCVRESAGMLAREGFEVLTGRLAPGGELDLEHLAGLLNGETVLVAQMLASNEVGTVYPIARLARLVRARAPQARLHVDAVQAFGKLECAPAVLGADSIAVSSHKIHGPQGMGALVLGGPSVIEPLWAGGGQEGARRSGTENLAAAIGFGAAAELAERERARTEAHLTLLRRRFLERLAEEPGHMQPLHDTSAGAASLPSIVVVKVRCAPAAVVLHHLEARGVLVSAGAACHSNKAGVSPALTAFGLSEDQARHVMRFSFARTTTIEEVERALAVAFEVCSALERQHA